MSSLSGQSILCFAPGPWRDMWRNRHQIMVRLARDNTVLWVEPRLSLRHTLRQLPQLKRSLAPHLEHVRDGLYVFHNPAALPANAPLGAGAVSSAMYQTAIRRAMEQAGMSHPILWLYLPEMADIIGEYGERLVVYHVVDEYSAYGGIPATYLPTMQALEEQLLQRADVVFVTAPALLQSKGRFSRNVYLVPNAVDFDAFQRTLALHPLPEAMTSLARPLIGYVGAINDKLDYALLAEVALARPQWTLALVGPPDVRLPEDVTGLDLLCKLPNVRLLRAVGVSDVPRYIAGCDVCLLPYKVNERTRNISSLKLYEYLACGKPVVSTDVPAAREAMDEAKVAVDARTFVEAVEHALADEPQAAQRRKRIAAANTWEQRIESMGAVLAKYL